MNIGRKYLMKKYAYIVGILCILTLFWSEAEADVIIYSQGSVSNLVDVFNPSDRDANVFFASRFTITAPGTIDTLSWLGEYRSSNTRTEPDDFNIVLFNEVGGFPGSVLLNESVVSTEMATGFTNGGFDVFSYTAGISSIALSTGVYWLSIANDTFSDINDDWAWSASSLATGFGRTANVTQTSPYGFPVNIFERTFTLSSSIPEPSTGILVVISGVIFVLFGKKQKP